MAPSTERLEAVLSVVKASRARTVLDLGCGDGPLLTRLVHEPDIHHVVGIDLSAVALQKLRAKLRSTPAANRQNVELICGSMTEPTAALAGFDVALLIETIEHVDPDRLSLVERAVFREMKPTSVIITTPNSEFNPLLGVPSHRLRHSGHRFEWTRPRFRSWAGGVARRSGYDVTFEDIAGAHPAYGGSTQMAVFRQPVGGWGGKAA